MSKKCLFAPALFLLFLLASQVAWAQTPEKQKSYKLRRPSSTLVQERQAEEEQAPKAYVPGIYGGDLECSLTMGFLDLNTTLLHGSQLVYKYTDAATYWGDVSLRGQSAFNPIVSLNYNLNSWLAFEPHFSISFSEYHAAITNRHYRANDDPEAPILNDPPLEEFDAERRSVVTVHLGLNGIVYPFNLNGDGKGRFQPFLLGGAQRSYFDLNSSYTGDTSASWTYRFGGGVRLITDDLISVRVQVTLDTTTIDFMPSPRWLDLNEGTVQVPVFHVVNGQYVILDDFASQKLSSLTWGLGFTASF
jgi:hypothetical protein